MRSACARLRLAAIAAFSRTSWVVHEEGLKDRRAGATGAVPQRDRRRSCPKRLGPGPAGTGGAPQQPHCRRPVAFRALSRLRAAGPRDSFGWSSHPPHPFAGGRRYSRRVLRRRGRKALLPLSRLLIFAGGDRRSPALGGISNPRRDRVGSSLRFFGCGHRRAAFGSSAGVSHPPAVPVGEGRGGPLSPVAFVPELGDGASKVQSPGLPSRSGGSRSLVDGMTFLPLAG